MNINPKNWKKYISHSRRIVNRRTSVLPLLVGLVVFALASTSHASERKGGRMLQLKATQQLDIERMKDKSIGMRSVRNSNKDVNKRQLKRQIERLKRRVHSVRQKNSKLKRQVNRLSDGGTANSGSGNPNENGSNNVPDIEECSIDPASPSIGTNIPETYFGPAPSTVNPSLIGPLQLLTAGQLDAVNRTITLPLYRGVLAGKQKTNVWYIATDTTDEANSQGLGLNFSAKLSFADNDRRAVRKARLAANGLLVFKKGKVDFSPERRVVASPEPTPFPPQVAEPGSVGDAFYSPLVKIENAGGHIWNMPIVAFGSSAEEINFPDGNVDYSKVHDAVASIDPFNETVTLDLVPGFSFARPVLYLSTDTNSEVAAALEAATFAPGLKDVEVGVDDSLFSAVERIFGFTNGQRGCENPQRQGFDAALTDGNSPFNVLGGIPTVATDYSPLWDLNLGEWTQDAIDRGFRGRLTEEFQILGIANQGYITGPGGSQYGSSGIIINCPIVHRFL